MVAGTASRCRHHGEIQRRTWATTRNAGSHCFNGTALLIRLTLAICRERQRDSGEDFANDFAIFGARQTVFSPTVVINQLVMLQSNKMQYRRV